MNLTRFALSLMTAMVFSPLPAFGNDSMPTQDRLFMKDVIKLSTTYSPPSRQAIEETGLANVIKQGHNVCSKLDAGQGIEEISKERIRQMAITGMTRQDFDKIWNPYFNSVIISAIQNLCPQHRKLLRAYIN